MATAATGSDSTLSSSMETLKHVIDVEVLEDLTPLSDERMIYTVPSNLRKMDEEAFTPQLISIGPIHLGKEELKEMQKLKHMYLKFFWERVSKEEVMKAYKCFLESNVGKIRDCYTQKFPEISDEKFVEIVLIDAMFIVEYFLRESEFNHGYKLTNYVRKGIQRDLLLLENQLPFFVLEELHHNAVTLRAEGHLPYCKDFLQLTHRYFASLYLYSEKYSERVDYKGVHHFVDFVRRCCLPVRRRPWELDVFRRQATLQVSATKLYQAGVSFDCVVDRGLVDITFETKKPFNGNLLCLGCLPSCFKSFRALLKFPRLKVDNGTAYVLKNLMAFEQNHYWDKPFITSYVSLLDSLVHTKEDVELLVENGCIFRQLVSDEEVVNLVKGLSKHVVPGKTSYLWVIRDLNRHCKSDWKRTMGTVRRVYFRDTWRGSSTIIAIFVLIFTIFGFYRDIRAFVLSN